jgi:hypothetical protein
MVKASIIAAHHLAIVQAGADLEVVHGLALGPVVPIARDQPNADRVASSHEPIAIVLDLMNPV